MKTDNTKAPVLKPSDEILEMSQENLLEIKDLHVGFDTYRGIVPAVDGVDLAFPKGQVIGVVGESGCGKTVTALSVIRLLSEPPARIRGGSIRYRTTKDLIVDVSALDNDGIAVRRLRGKEIAMIFQEPMTSLTPVYSIGKQITEKLHVHFDMSKNDARLEALRLLEQVGIGAAKQRLDEYPHQMSGGMRQRVIIAIAMACDPQLLIADEPTTALDVTVQAQILALMQDLRDRTGTSIMLITHDLAVIGEMAQEVAVMYLGKVVEYNTVNGLFSSPKHPYTRGLMRSIPLVSRRKRVRLQPILGSVPDPFARPMGCSFHPRCPVAMDICREKYPPVFQLDEKNTVRCWKYQPPADHREVDNEHESN